ncbi:MAG: response regulator [Patescibacteria group bacterium]
MPTKLNKLKILHVDDEDDTLEVVKTILEKEGFEVTGAKRGEEALKKIKTNGFDLLILDVMMPDMSGWELFNKISVIKPNYHVIFLTILELTQEKIKEIKKAGIRDYIRKPFDRQDFVNRVKKAISS